MKAAASVALFMLVAPLLFAQDTSAATAHSPADFAAESDRSQNAHVLELLAQYDLGEQLAMLRALARRSDPYIGEIITGIAHEYRGRDQYRNELLLRTLVEAFFSAPPGADPRAAERVAMRLAANRAELERLLRSIGSIQDPLLRRDLLRLASSVLGAGAVKMLAVEGRFLIGLLRQAGGALDPERIEEAVACLDAAAPFRDPVLREQAVTIAALATDGPVVAAARAALGR